MRVILTYVGLLAVVLVPLVAAALSPLLAWRDPVYIAGGFAGIVALILTGAQPMLAGGDLPGLSVMRSRRIHRGVGLTLVAAVVVHVGALWITSPPDMIDALVFASPTPFSDWGVVAMWAVFATALLAAFRKRLRLRPRTWRLGHMTLAGIIVVGSIVHAVLIEGTMETMSKLALCALVLVVSVRTIAGLRGRGTGSRS